MSIKKLKKITFYGLTSEKKIILDAFQQLGCLHLIPLQQQREQRTDAALNTTAETKKALDYLVSCPIKRRIARTTEQPVSELIEAVLENKEQMRKLLDKRDKLTERIEVVRPWGNFDFSLLEKRVVSLWFYTVRPQHMEMINTLGYPYEVVYQDNKFYYLVILAKEEPDPEKIPVERSHIGTHSLDELERMKEDVEQMLDENQLERMRLTHWIHIIDQAVAQAEDKKTFYEAYHSTFDVNQMFLVSGWMPDDQEQEVRKLIEKYKLAAIIEEPEKEESPPSLIEYAKTTGGGSDTMLFFTTPSYRAWDPGTVVFISFCLFFSMIMNDAMYSAIFGLITACFHKKMGKSPSGCRLRTMFYCMSGTGFIWGVLAGSYFGVVPTSSLLGALNIIDMNNYAAMMKLSVIIGAVHIIIANTVVAWNNRKSLHALTSVGWIVLVKGGITLWLYHSYQNQLSSVWQQIGVVLMITGAICILFFESHRPLNSLKNIMLRLVDGLGGLWHITGAFGDILSYMRLFALGLAGLSLADTFNGIVEIRTSVMGVLICPLVLFFGHLLNLALSLMAAFVHGIRLNIIEFFKWALPDEGYPFKPFKKLEESD